jgi:hypothetical protein
MGKSDFADSLSKTNEDAKLECVITAGAEAPTDVFCPYLPPLAVVRNRITQAIEGVNYASCLGKLCAVYDQCQGPQSPKVKALKLNFLLAYLEGIVESVPFAGDALKNFISAALKAGY